MNLPVPPASYDARDQAETRRSLEQEDRRNRKIGTDVEIGGDRLVLKSPDGTRWSVTVSDLGVITATAL